MNYNIVLLVIAVLLVVFHEQFGMTLVLAGVLAVIIVVVVLAIRQGSYLTEGMGIADVDIEAIKNIASLYNTGNMTINNMTVTDTLKVGNAAKISASGGDRLMVFKNADGKAPYLYFNDSGSMGVWDGAKSAWSLGAVNGYGSLAIGNSVRMDADPSKDSVQVYRDSNGGAPYMFFDKAGTLGMYNGSRRTASINTNGDIGNINMTIYGDPNAQNKFTAYVNGDGNQPLLYFNKDARLGLYADPGGDVWFAEGKTPCNSTRGKYDGQFYAHRTCGDDWFN